MEGFVTLDEVGDEEDSEHQKQRKSGMMRSVVKTEDSLTEEMGQENEALENGGKTENSNVEQSEASESTATQEGEKKENADLEETKTACEKLAAPDEYSIGPYQPNVPVGKNTFCTPCVIMYQIQTPEQYLTTFWPFIKGHWHRMTF